MANRFFRSSRLFSSFGMPVMLSGRIALQQPVKASKVTQGITLTAVKWGSDQNAITIAFTAGATAGAEVVSVSGNAISVQIESGVSTVTQVRTAINASVPAAALVTASGTAITTVSAAAALPLLGGVDMVSDFSIFGVESIAQNPDAAGELIVTLSDAYASCASAMFSMEASSAVDLVPQMKSVDVSSAKQVIVRLLSGATATNPSGACHLHMMLMLNNSSQS